MGTKASTCGSMEAMPDAYSEKGRFTPPNPPDRGKYRFRISASGFFLTEASRGFVSMARSCPTGSA